jgi:hypothetical protein
MVDHLVKGMRERERERERERGEKMDVLWTLGNGGGEDARDNGPAQSLLPGREAFVWKNDLDLENIRV